MLELTTKSQFKKDLRLMQRRGKNPHQLWQIVDILLAVAAREHKTEYPRTEPKSAHTKCE